MTSSNQNKTKQIIDARDRLQTQLSFAERNLPEGITGYEITRTGWCEALDEPVWTLRVVRTDGRPTLTLLLLEPELSLVGALRALTFLGAPE